jgi:hypothetical protein
MMEETKIYAANMFTIYMTLTDIEEGLKILLLVLSVIYTSIKIYETFKKNKNEN